MVWNFFEFGIEQMGYHVINKFINRFILYSFRVFFWISNILNSKKMLFNYSAHVFSLSLSLFFFFLSKLFIIAKKKKFLS